jgi:Cu/Ag efflux protein CusF
MSKRAFSVLTLCFLLAAPAAHAQIGGGGGRGGGGGGRGGGQKSQAPSSSAPTPSSTAIPQQTPLSKIEIVGVIKAIDPAAARVTISYEPVDALDWPAGTMPFVVAKPGLLDGAKVGEKVRFKLESQQISQLTPFVPAPESP